LDGAAATTLPPGPFVASAVLVAVATGLLTAWITVGSTSKLETFENGAASAATNGVAEGACSVAIAAAVGSSNKVELSTEPLSASAAPPKKKSPGELLEPPVIAANKGAYGPDEKLATLGFSKFSRPAVTAITTMQIVAISEFR
jgi:hypothetical protein